MADGAWIAGVDGCKGGWIAVLMRPDGTEAHVRDVLPRFTDLLDLPEAPSIVAVDMPIGLPAHSHGGRKPDGVARKLLGPRGSSVFPVPSRSAVFAETDSPPDSKARLIAHRNACAVAAATSTPPRRMSIFTFGLLPKIREIDDALHAQPRWRTRVFETHPELAFRELNQQRTVIESKKDDAGRAIRRSLLIEAGFTADFVHASPPRGAQRDDLLDACVCAVVARRICAKTARQFPDDPELDEELGIPMAIWA